MQPTASHGVWSQLSPSEQSAVVDDIVRVLMEEMEHERICKDSIDTPGPSGGGLFEAVGPQASPPEPGERDLGLSA
jgi:hypothetical protein